MPDFSKNVNADPALMTVADVARLRKTQILNYLNSGESSYMALRSEFWRIQLHGDEK